LSELIGQRARDVYHRREMEYPIEHVMGYVGAGEVEKIDNPYVADFLQKWAQYKFSADLPVEQILSLPIPELRAKLLGFRKQYMVQNGVEKDVEAILAKGPALAPMAAAFNERFGQAIEPKDLDPLTAATRKGTMEVDQDGSGSVTTRDVLLRRVRSILRDELTRLEQSVLITIFDQSWKDHLYAMDVLKGGIGLQSFGEKDPRVIYKREGYKFFEQMLEGIRDKVTDLIFRVHVQDKEVVMQSAYKETSAQHQVSDNYGVGDNVRETAAAVDAPAAEAAENAEQRPATVQTIVRDQPKVGRNDPCPCGSGKKYKNCHGAND
jgi:preprotein translocase subunit SecA